MVQTVSVIRNSLNTIRNSMKRKDIESQLLHNEACSSRRHSIWWTLGVDIPLFIIVAALIGLQEFGAFPQRKNGFFCNDPALSYPFNGDTVSMTMIISTIVALPLALIFLTELALHGSSSARGRLYCSAMETLILYRSYAYGLFINIAIVEVMKGVTGFPRPTFFDLCEPDTAKTCNGSEFVSTFTCTSERYPAWYQMDSYHSFPSGHTSLSVYCAFFMAWYLQVRAFDWSHRTVLLVPALQLGCVAYAAVCSLTRLTDHRHHWWDVLTGAAVGILCLVYTVLVLCDSFSTVKRRPVKDTNESNPPSTRTTIYDDRIEVPVT